MVGIVPCDQGNEVGRAYGMYRGEQKCIQGFGGET
jgi:hypothetical protein